MNKLLITLRHIGQKQMSKKKKGQGFSRRVTLQNLEGFASLLRRKSDREKTKRQNEAAGKSSETDPELISAESLFAGKSIKTPITPPPTSTSRRTERKPRSKSPSHEVIEPMPFETSSESIDQSGPLVWEKRNLPASDVQRQKGNVTGGLRLVQANFTDAKGKLIDQTTYFRYSVFGDLNWTIGHHKPKKRETVQVAFQVTILGKAYGQQGLIVSHKPSGEANQRNYTTMLHWGELGQIISNLNLIGKTFRLYAPPEGEDEPFFIEIVD